MVFEAFAATSAMSRLFQTSATIRSAFVQITKEGGGLMLLFDDEDIQGKGALAMVWPTQHDLPLEEQPYPLTGESLDSYCTRYLTAAGIQISLTNP
jgi:hypothetical protein